MIVGSVLADAGGRRPVGAASMTGIGNFLLAAAAIHPGRDRATPTTPFEIDGATQVWHLSARYAQFRAPAFPSSLPCRSRCRALAGLARAQTSDDIRPRALCTPPPKSFARSPRTLHPANAATGSRCGQHLSRPEYTSKPKVTFAPQHTALRVRPLRAEPLRAGFHMILKRDRRRRTVKAASWLPADPGPRQARALRLSVASSRSLSGCP